MVRELQTGRTERNQFKISTTTIVLRGEAATYFKPFRSPTILSTGPERKPCLVLTSYLNVEDVRGGVALQVAGEAGVVPGLLPADLLQDEAGAADENSPAEVLNHLEALQ